MVKASPAGVQGTMAATDPSQTGPPARQALYPSILSSSGIPLQIFLLYKLLKSK